ncbi:Glutathione S-transferase zeta class [Heracleum sosnowskyi]|uniref:Glutathione S-transferase zeta class n=1 Tax=Heracleum sosnowskyi TaxID=360622 RepID=A0AAD8JDK0_9APIA|nr:Glutathione S-transferase zeta class [Heracleum sosnowskyi]
MYRTTPRVSQMDRRGKSYSWYILKKVISTLFLEVDGFCDLQRILFFKNLQFSYDRLIHIDVLVLFEILKLSPFGMVPELVDGDIVIADSFAILMYLEENHPQDPSLSNDLQNRALNYQVYA